MLAPHPPGRPVSLVVVNGDRKPDAPLCSCVMLAVPGKSIALLVHGVGLRLAAVNILVSRL